MDEIRRKKKRLFILGIYVMIFVVIPVSTYLLMMDRETCSDGIKNQNEEDVDCGGICQSCQKISAEDLTVGQVGFIGSDREGSVDAFGEIVNPNGRFGGREIHYTFIFKDDTQKIFEKTGETFILPGEKKFVIESNISPGKLFSSLEMRVDSVEWVAFNSYYERPQIKIINRNYTEINSSSIFSDITGILRNESPFDFNRISLNVLLRSETNEILAVNTTEMRTVKSGEERGFRVFWPGKFNGEVARVEVQPEVDIFDSQVFFERYFQPQKFQQYQ